MKGAAVAHVNVEIKAQCARHDDVRAMLQSRGADFRGTDHQVDTYFNVARGRLKLREGHIENALIHYQRDDVCGPKRSDVVLYRAPRDASLKESLAAALGVLVVVDKRREILFIGNVKFHLDTVAGLGEFIEIEAIDEDGTMGVEKLRAQCEHYLGLLSVPSEDLVAESYSDLLLHRR